MSDKIAPPRLLLRLEAEIANARTPLEADCKRAERAAYLARSSGPDGPLVVVAELQQRYGGRPNPRISAWVHLVLGLIDHARSLDPKARERILRAHALSSAADLVRERALSAAWIAHMDYLRVDASSMARHASESIRLAAPGDHSTLSRASLVVAQAYHLADRMDLALAWYARARKHASEDGDEATLSALMHNMAWLRTQQLRMKGWFEGRAVPDDGHALLGAQSVANFDLAIGAKGASSSVPLLQAQAHAARGHFNEALSLYDRHLGAATVDGLGRLYADLLADQAWCRVNLGQLEEALRDANASEAQIDPDGQFDDRAMAHARLAQVFLATGSENQARFHESQAHEAFAGHATLKKSILDNLGQRAETRSE